VRTPHDAIRKDNIAGQKPVEPAGRVYFRQRELEPATVLVADPASWPLMVPMPVRHLVNSKIFDDAVWARLKWMRRTEARSKNSQPTLYRPKSARSTCGYGIQFIANTPVGEVEGKDRALACDCFRYAEAFISAKSKLIQASGEIMCGTLSVVPEQPLAGPIGLQVPADNVISTNQAEECLIWHPLIQRENAAV